MDTNDSIINDKRTEYPHHGSERKEVRWKDHRSPDKVPYKMGANVKLNAEKIPKQKKIVHDAGKEKRPNRNHRLSTNGKTWSATAEHNKNKNEPRAR